MLKQIVLSKRNYFYKLLWLLSIFVLISFYPEICLSDNTNISDKNRQNEFINIPKLELDKNSYDFGDIKPNSTNTAVFNLKNTGNKPLVIKDVKKCCGTVIKLDRKELAHGEIGILTAKYNTGSNLGLFKKEINIVTNEPNNSETTLTITGKVIQTLKWEPETFKVASFGKDANCPDMKIKSLDNTKFSIKNFASSGNCLSAKLDPNYSASEIIIKPKLIPGKLKELNTNNGSILIELNHPDYKQINLNFEVIPSLQATPSQFVVFNTDVNEPITKSIVLQDNEKLNEANISKQIKSITSENGTKIEMISSSMVDKNCKLDLKITPVAKKGSESLLKDQIVIKLKDGRTLNVPISIFYATQTLTSKAG